MEKEKYRERQIGKEEGKKSQQIELNFGSMPLENLIVGLAIAHCSSIARSLTK